MLSKEEKKQLLTKDMEALEKYVARMNRETLKYTSETKQVTVEEFIESVCSTEINNAKEEAVGINISKYLKTIRDKKYECNLSLIIKDGKVIDTVISKGIAIMSRIDTSEIIKKAEGADCIITIHNHPFNIGAKISYNDLLALMGVCRILPCKVYMGIVTKYDYWQSDQDNTHQLTKCSELFDSDTQSHEKVDSYVENETTSITRDEWLRKTAKSARLHRKADKLIREQIDILLKAPVEELSDMLLNKQIRDSIKMIMMSKMNEAEYKAFKPKLEQALAIASEKKETKKRQH